MPTLSKQHNYYVYITTNRRKTVLYTGVTNDLERRLCEHAEAAGNRATFAGRYNCHHLVYFEYYSQVEDAIRREKEIKGWVRAKKEALIAGVNPEWHFLSEGRFWGEMGKYCGNPEAF